ncbi:MAG: hypothetical protein DMG00_08325 [Acidobacteria bacterium]|nr:MAG: hypothetical protein DMG00_08325 [Acidobacteriota bacterium]
MFAIILYHGIDSGERWDRSMTPTDREYVLSRPLFEEHIAYLSTNAVTVASLRACRGASDDGSAASSDRSDRRPVVVLTFDDGDVSGYTTAAPILERFGFRGEFFVVTDWIGRAGFMTAGQLRELSARGHRIHSHSRTHPRLPALETAAIDEEVIASKRELEAITGAPVEYFSIPNGAYDVRVLDAARRSGYAGALNSTAGYNERAIASFVLRRFSAKSYTTVADLASICERPRYTAARVALRRSTLAAAKHMLGGRYDRLRHALVSRKGRS